MKFNIKEYLVITALGHLFFVIVLSGWLIWIVGLNSEQYLTWLWQGTLIDLVLAYGVVKWTAFWIAKIRKKYPSFLAEQSK